MSRPDRHPLLIALLALVLPAAASAQADTVTVKRATQLRESAAESAPSLAPLPLQATLTRLGARRGPWIEVRTAQGQSGWVHLFDVGTVPVAQGGNFATGALRGLTGLFGGGNALAPPGRTATATIGIRGLEAQDIANAQPNLNAVALVETLRVDALGAQQFASTARLSAQRVDALPVPPRPTNAPSGTGAGGTTGGER